MPGLTNVEIKDGMFKFWIEVQLAVGAVGGLTSPSSMVKFSRKLLGLDAEGLARRL